MKISVITVCYNSAQTIEDCIQSVLSQDYDDVEYIVIDGASSDSTGTILDKYASGISHIVSEPDTGIYNAMNKGVALATGDIIGILNSDDLYADKNVLSTVAKEFTDASVDGLCTDVSIFSGNRDNIRRKYRCTSWKPWMFRIGHQPPHPGFFVRKKCYSTFGNFNEDYRTAADFDLLFRFIYKHKIKVKYLGFSSVYMRGGGASQNGFKAISKANLEVHNSLKRNGYFSWFPLIWLKYAVKVFQFL